MCYDVRAPVGGLKGRRDEGEAKKGENGEMRDIKGTEWERGEGR